MWRHRECSDVMVFLSVCCSYPTSCYIAKNLSFSLSFSLSVACIFFFFFFTVTFFFLLSFLALLFFTFLIFHWSSLFLNLFSSTFLFLSVCCLYPTSCYIAKNLSFSLSFSLSVACIFFLFLFSFSQSPFFSFFHFSPYCSLHSLFFIDPLFFFHPLFFFTCLSIFMHFAFIYLRFSVSSPWGNLLLSLGVLGLILKCIQIGGYSPGALGSVKLSLCCYCSLIYSDQEWK